METLKGIYNLFIAMAAVKKMRDAMKEEKGYFANPVNQGYFGDYSFAQRELNVLRDTRKLYLSKDIDKDNFTVGEGAFVDLQDFPQDDGRYQFHQFNKAAALLIYADDTEQKAVFKIFIDPKLMDEEIKRLEKDTKRTLAKAKKQMLKHITKNDYLTIDRPNEDRPEVTCTRLIIDGRETERPDLDKLDIFEVMDVLVEEHKKIERKLFIPSFYYHQMIEEVTGKNKKLPYTKTSLHLERQRFGKVPDRGRQLTIDDFLNGLQDEEERELAKMKDVTCIGIDPSLAGNKAIHAIQTLLTRMNYKGNAGGKQWSKAAKGNSHGFNGYLPRMRIKPAEYLEAYGVTKHTTGREKEEYSGEGRKQAFAALNELQSKLCLFQYPRTEFTTDSKGKKEEITWQVITARPLLSELEFLVNKDTKQTEYIELTPCFVLVDQIETYFVMKPANQYAELQQTFGKIDKTLALFIDFLHVTRTDRLRHKEGLKDLQITFEVLAYKLRLEWRIKQRQWKQLRTQLTGYFEKAKQLEYITCYEIVEGYSKETMKAVYTINADKAYIPKHALENPEDSTKNEG